MSKLEVLRVEERLLAGETEEESKKRRIRIFDVIYRNKNGQERKWNLFSRNSKDILEKDLFENYRNIDGICIYSIHKPTNKLVIIKEQRIGVNTTLYTFPAGIMEKGETIYETAVRELNEETGLNLTEVTHIDKARFSAVGLTNEKVVIVKGYCEGMPSTDNQTANENAEIMLVDELEVRRILDEEEVAGRTALLLENYLLQMELERYRSMYPLNPKKVVAFDMDGVLADFDEGFLKRLNEIKGTNYTKKDITRWNLKELFGDIANDIIREKDFFLYLSPIQHLVDTMKKLIAEDEYKVVILTACEPKSYIEKIMWLEKYIPEIPYTDVIGITHKYYYNADLLIDDAEHNVVNFRRHKLLVDTNYNQSVQGVNRIYETDSVDEIVQKIKNELNS